MSGEMVVPPSAPTIPPHVLLLPYPSQGHINPMLQFGKRLASKGTKVTLVTTTFIINSAKPNLESVELESISDGHDEGGVRSSPDLETYLKSLKEIGSKTLRILIDRYANSDRPFTCIIFDTYVPWAIPLARQIGLKVVAFSTQSASASSIYYYVTKGMVEIPKVGQRFDSSFGLPPMERWEFPSMAVTDQPYPTLSMASLNQFENLKSSDWVLINTFEELETPVITAWKQHLVAKAIGPTVPSILVDGSSYDFNLQKSDISAASCLRWLSGNLPGSVVYVSFGSLSDLSSKQFGELAAALMASPSHFLWVVRSSELEKLPEGFQTTVETTGKGLVVTWCSQLEVLMHRSTGCFVTHCGWNSTLEALSMGVPMVAMPQWTDQPTNAKLVEEVWGVGVRPRFDVREGVVDREEIEKCIGEVMAGEGRGKNVRANACKWKEKVRRALGEGGTSDENLNDFVKFLG